MLKKMNLKVNKFFVIFFIVMGILSLIVIYSGKNIFNAFLISNETNSDNGLENIKIDEEKFNQAYSMIFEKKVDKLLIK